MNFSLLSMLLILKEQQTNILKEREILIQELEWKYSCYSCLLLKQKILIATTITNQSDEIINRINNSICYVNLKTDTEKHKSESKSLKILLNLKQQQKNVLKQREILIQQLELKYNMYIQCLLQQKMFISTRILKQYDEIVNGINYSIYNYINNKINILKNNYIYPNIISQQIKNTHLYNHIYLYPKKKNYNCNLLNQNISKNVAANRHINNNNNPLPLPQSFKESKMNKKEKIIPKLSGYKFVENNNNNNTNNKQLLPLMSASDKWNNVESNINVIPTVPTYSENVETVTKVKPNIENKCKSIKQQHKTVIKPIHPSLNIYIPKVNLKCTYCDKLFDTLRSFGHHMKNKHNISTPYKCQYDKCVKCYTNKRHLIGHISVIHIKQSKYECDKCQKLFYNKTDCNKHIYKCGGSKRIIQNDNPALHIYVSKVNLKCIQCDKLFNIVKDFENHMKIKHNNFTPYKCLYDNCLHRYTCKKALIDHIRVKHIKQSKYKCNLCHKLFYNNTDLQKHMVKCEEKIFFDNKMQTIKSKVNVSMRPNQKLIRNDNDRNRALQIYIGEINTDCIRCKISFYTFKEFERHMKIKHNIFKPYKCLYDKCNKYYTTKNHLMNHIRIKHIKSTKYACNICHKGFWTKNGRDNHIGIHKVDKCNPYKCNRCFRSFKTFKQWTSHQKNSHNELKIIEGIHWVRHTVTYTNESKSNRSQITNNIVKHNPIKSNNMDVPLLEPNI